MLDVHGIKGFASLRTEILYHLCIKTAFIPPVEWDETQTSNLPVSWYNENLACKTPLKPLRRKCLYDFQTLVSIRKTLKRDFNVSLNVFPCPLPHQSSGRQYQCTVSTPRQSCSLGLLKRLGNGTE